MTCNAWIISASTPKWEMTCSETACWSSQKEQFDGYRILYDLTELNIIARSNPILRTDLFRRLGTQRRLNTYWVALFWPFAENDYSKVRNDMLWNSGGGVAKKSNLIGCFFCSFCWSEVNIIARSNPTLRTDLFRRLGDCRRLKLSPYIWGGTFWPFSGEF